MKYEMLSCGACRTCEIACSFHHTGKYSPSLSSIRIHEKDHGEGNVVELIEIDEGLLMACDGCTNREEPYCMEVCPEKDFLWDLIQRFLQDR